MNSLKILCFAILIVLMNCHTSKGTINERIENQELLYAEMISEVLAYSDTTHLRFLKKEDGCYKINAQIGFDKGECPYSFWNNLYYQECYLKGNCKLFNPENKRGIDWKLFNKNKENIILSKSTIIPTVHCYDLITKEFLENEAFHGLYRMPKHTVSFSHLISMKEINRFELWCTVYTFREQVSIIYDLEKVDDSFRVLDHYYSDHCMDPDIGLIGDHLVLLKE